MVKKQTTIINKTGLHARPASEFVAAATKFKSKITIKRIDSDKEANVKSIVFVLSLGLTRGTQVEIAASGEDEAEAVDTLVALIESGFGE
jgi:phosphocarrier protein HPr